MTATGRWRAYTRGIPITCGVNKRLAEGEEFELKWFTGPSPIRARVFKRITRKQHVTWTENLDAIGRALGIKGHTGSYDHATKQYTPGLDADPRLRFFYWIEIYDEAPL